MNPFGGMPKGFGTPPPRVQVRILDDNASDGTDDLWRSTETEPIGAAEKESLHRQR
jgi:hypothetical protein